VRRDRHAGSESKLSFTERQAQHELTGPLPDARWVLILDDFLASGESAAHVIELMRRHTSQMPEVVLAVPLWVPREDPAANFIR
jgi:adenine/guanine phosphoribosyltransferase-like PRPP-binding protein